MRAEQLEREYRVRVTWSPFELHPETPAEGRPRRPREGESPVEAAARSAGLIMRIPPFIANSRLALEAAEFARDEGADASARLHHAVFRAYFEEGRNIGDPDVLVTIGRAQGLDGDRLRDALAERRYRERVDAAIQWAAGHSLTSTPTFVLDNRLAVVGAQDYELFESLMQRLGVPRR